MADPFHILLPTDVFPPIAGGAGWSAYALARALQTRGHRVTAIVPRSGPPGQRRDDVGGVPVIEVGYTAPHLPFVQNYYRFELLWPLLQNVIVAEALRERELPLVIHGQHAQTIPASVLAGHELDIPVVATVRDVWPWHYFATGLLGDRLPFECQTPATVWLDLIGRLGPTKGMLAAVAIPYMLRHVRRRTELLAQANAVVAVSNYMRRKLQPLVGSERLHVIPNLIDVGATERTASQPSRAAPSEPFVLYVGKLERNKGAHLLPEVLAATRRVGVEPPLLLLAGNGDLATPLREAFGAQGLRHQLLQGWTDHDEVLRLMLRAEVVLFPSTWGEPLSRVLIEASAAGACIAAMATGGTPDIIVDGESGLLVGDAHELGFVLAQLLNDPQRRRQLRAGARRIAAERFAEDVVASRMEALYRQMHARHRDKAASR